MPEILPIKLLVVEVAEATQTVTKADQTYQDDQRSSRTYPKPRIVWITFLSKGSALRTGWFWALTFNEMLDRLQDAFARLSRFSGDLAHELRTPLGNLRGEAEVILARARTSEEYREVLMSGFEEYARLERIIDSLLFIARAESPEAQIERSWLDLSKELETVKDFYQAVAAERGITLLSSTDGAVVAELDRTLFQRALWNLLANSLAYTPPGGMVIMTAGQANSVLPVRVIDMG